MDLKQIHERLAELLYVQEQQAKRVKAKDLVAFTQLEEERKQGYLDQAEAAMVAIDRMDLCLSSKIEAQNREGLKQVFGERLEAFLRDFCAVKVKHFKKDLFPYGELAIQIRNMLFETLEGK